MSEMTTAQVSSTYRRRDSLFEQISDINTFQKILLCCKYGAMNSLEKYFRWHGKLVASYPILFLIGSLMSTIILSLGLISFREEHNLTALWVPVGSKLRNNVEWVQQNFPQQLRFNQVIFKSQNVLTPEVIQEMYNLTMRMRQVTHNNQTWEDVCFRVPVVSKPRCLDASSLEYYALFGRKRKKRFTDQEFDNWLEEGNEDTVDDECKNFTLPKFSAEQMSSLLPLARKYKEEGFSLEVVNLINQKFYPEPYCTLVDTAPTVCFEESLLELWTKDGDLDMETIFSLSQNDILNTINTNNRSGIYLREKNFTNMLGEIRYNETGHIVGAAVTSITLLGKVNLTALREFGSAGSRGDVIDRFTYNYEGEMIEVATDRNSLAKGVEIYVNIARMLFETLEGQVFKDIDMLVGGYAIVFIYVLVMLGRWNCIQQKAYLSMGGIFGVMMGIIVSYGLCSAFGFFYSTAHAVMPFLLLGVGIDDMFVIVQCLNTLTEHERSKPLVERIGAMMSHAGAAITITSVTNFMAFGIGATSSLPALRSFCMYASIGILTIFFFQITWFVALLTIDEKRVEQRRNGCCCCFIHQINDTEDKPDKSDESHKEEHDRNCLGFSSHPGLTARLFEFLSVKLILVPVKLLVILITSIILGFGLYGLTLLKMEFRPEWMLDPETEFTSWYYAHKEFFPADGEVGQIYIRGVNYSKNFVQLENLVNNLEGQSDIIKNVDSWVAQYKIFVEETDKEVDWTRLSEEFFMEKLTQFLFSPRGAKYKNQFKFSSSLECGSGTRDNVSRPRVLVSQINYQHTGFESASEWIPAMDRVTMMVEESNITRSEDDYLNAEKDVNVTDAVFPLAMRYSNWETDKIIGRELYQNMITSLLAIFLTVLVFLGSLRASCIVIFCVASTILEVAGFMHFWGLTIDVISCNTLVISIGLCVDFSAHIAHGFLTRRGSRNQRVSFTLTKVGPAVLNGGLSTLLAFILLSSSESYVCLSFFKIFFLICIFGLYNGLVTLPVILTIFGPVPQVVEVYPEDIDDLTLYDKYAVKANNNKSNDDNMNKVENERSSSFHAEL